MAKKRTGLVFTGKFRPAKGDAKTIFFARPGESKWVELRTDQIKKIKLVRPPRSNGHPVVNLEMKQPLSREGETFASLAQLHSPTPSAPGSTDLCWDSGQQAWVPCPG
jgi:hypothetical protein